MGLKSLGFTPQALCSHLLRRLFVQSLTETMLTRFLCLRGSIRDTENTVGLFVEMISRENSNCVVHRQGYYSLAVRTEAEVIGTKAN